MEDLTEDVNNPAGAESELNAGLGMSDIVTNVSETIYLTGLKCRRVGKPVEVQIELSEFLRHRYLAPEQAAFEAQLQIEESLGITFLRQSLGHYEEGKWLPVEEPQSPQKQREEQGQCHTFFHYHQGNEE